MSYSYSPVAAFALSDTSNDCLQGYAAPNGATSAQLRLISDDTTIAVVKATGYSAAAAAAGLRLGWCGFELHGLQQAFAVGDAVRICCGVSGEVLATLPREALTPVMPPAKQLSVLDLISAVRSTESCPSMHELLPFAVNHYRRHGARQFIEASYQTLLGRWPDTNATDIDFEIDTEEKRVESYLDVMINSEEYQEKWGGVIPGPFMAGFRFDLSGLL